MKKFFILLFVSFPLVANATYFIESRLDNGCCNDDLTIRISKDRVVHVILSKKDSHDKAKIKKEINKILNPDPTPTPEPLD